MPNRFGRVAAVVVPPRLPSVSAYLEHYAAEIPGVPMVVHGERTVSYADGLDQVRELASALLACGIRHGDRFAVYAHPHADCLMTFLAGAYVGAIFVGLNPKHSVDELRHVMDDAQPKLLFVFGSFDAEHHEKLEALVGAIEGDPEVVAGDPTNAPGGWTPFTDFTRERGVDDATLAAARAAIGPQDPVAMVYTSGSSGTPKGALLVNAPMMRSYAVQSERWYEERPVGVAELPINHLGFVGDNCMTLFVAGGTIHILERWKPEAILELIERERLTFWWTQTTLLLLATQSERWKQTDLSSLYRIAFGGAPVTQAMMDALVETGVPLSTGYGMTEVHGNMTYAESAADPEVLINTVGRPHPEFEVRIVDDEGSECPAGEPGEIVVRSDTMFGGYRDRSGAIDPARDEDGWYHTKDMALQREDGNYVLTGRKDNMFKSGGYNVYPREIEQVLERHPAVAVAAIVSVEDAKWARVGHAYVLAAMGAEIDAESLRAHAREHLANYKVPKRFVICSELPMLPSGKVDVRAIRTAAERGEPLAAEIA
jgi:acyl-CoA synthetase (AMP-forming)/AMP-acid ligase II